MEETYVRKSEFLDSVTEIKMKVNEIDLNIKELKKDVKQLSELSGRLRRLLVESNGRESIVDTVRRHDRELSDVVDYISKQKQDVMNKWGLISNTFWKYLIRIVVVGTLLSFMSLLLGHSDLIGELLKQILKGVMK